MPASIDLSVIIVNYNKPELIEACLESIGKYLIGIRKEILIIDNNSDIQDLANCQKQNSELRVIYLHTNMGFGYASNVGAKNARGNILLLLNSDTEFTDSTFKDMLSSFQTVKPSEIWGPRLTWPDGTFQNSYSRNIGFVSFITNYTSLFRLSSGISFVKAHKYENIDFINKTEVQIIYSTALLIYKSDYDRLGGFSRKYFMYFEDIDLCDRFRREIGGSIRVYPNTTLIHRVQGSAISGRFNLKYTISKYTYGANKFGYFAMAIILPLDLILGLAIKIFDKVVKSFASIRISL